MAVVIRTHLLHFLPLLLSLAFEKAPGHRERDCNYQVRCFHRLSGSQCVLSKLKRPYISFGTNHIKSPFTLPRIQVVFSSCILQPASIALIPSVS